MITKNFNFFIYQKLETYLETHVKETINTKYGRKGYNLVNLAVDKLQMEVSVVLV